MPEGETGMTFGLPLKGTEPGRGVGLPGTGVLEPVPGVGYGVNIGGLFWKAPLAWE